VANVLVIGASKGIGLEAAKQALARGHSVRAFARGAAEIDMTDPRLEKRPGDALDPHDVADALEGIDVVIQALGVTPGPDMILGPISLFSDATRILLAAMQEAGVRRLISVTGFGAGDSRARFGCLEDMGFRLFLGRVYDDKGIQEQLIKDSGLDWVIARPVILTKGSHSGRYRVLVERDKWRNGLISRADAADFLVAQIDDDSYLGTTPVLTY
jgi:putative NADH-flavin reductase